MIELSKALSGGSKDVGSAIAEALVSIDGESTVPAIIRTLKHNVGDQRINAAGSLRKINPKVNRTLNSKRLLELI